MHFLQVKISIYFLSKGSATLHDSTCINAHAQCGKYVKSLDILTVQLRNKTAFKLFISAVGSSFCGPFLAMSFDFSVDIEWNDF